MTGLVIAVDCPKALLVAASVFVPLGLLLHAGMWAGGWIGDRAGQVVAHRIRARRGGGGFVMSGAQRGTAPARTYLHPRRWS